LILPLLPGKTVVLEVYMVKEAVRREAHILVADEAWVALAMLQRAHPGRHSFSAKEIIEQVKIEHAHPELRPGVQAHIYQHNVANLEPNSAQYRMFYRLEDDTLRLFRPGDRAFASRKGKIIPDRSDLPEKYHDLLDWYEREYSQHQPRRGRDEANDPVLQMWGLGKDIWANTSADDFVRNLRSGWPGAENLSDAVPLIDAIWSRLVQHQGQEFQTSTGLPFTYDVEGPSGIWFYRDGSRINQRLSRGDVEKAVRKCPLAKTSDISECRDYAYLFGLLTDPRIHADYW
jgi:hypothetical protein